MRKSFILYHSHYTDSIKGLSYEDKGKLFDAIFHTAGTDAQMPELGLLSLAFDHVKADMERALEKYEDRCQKNKENGKKGGRPKKANISAGNTNNQMVKNETEQNQMVSSETENNPPVNLETHHNPYDDDNDDDDDNDVLNNTLEKIDPPEKEENKKQEQVLLVERPKGNNNCPQQEIVALYHEILPELRTMRIWSAKRQRALKSRWREDKEIQTIEWWKRFFERIRNCPWLMGANERAWQADLEWMLRPDKFVDIREGKYLAK